MHKTYFHWRHSFNVNKTVKNHTCASRPAQNMENFPTVTVLYFVLWTDRHVLMFFGVQYYLSCGSAAATVSNKLAFYRLRPNLSSPCIIPEDVVNEFHKSLIVSFKKKKKNLLHLRS